MFLRPLEPDEIVGVEAEMIDVVEDTEALLVHLSACLEYSQDWRRTLWLGLSDRHLVVGNGEYVVIDAVADLAGQRQQTALLGLWY